MWKSSVTFFSHSSSISIHTSIQNEKKRRKYWLIKDCGFELVDLTLWVPELALPWKNSWRVTGIEVMMKSYLLLMTFSYPKGWELLHFWNPSNTTPMEDVCGPQGGICWKLNLFWPYSMNVSWSAYNFFTRSMFVYVCVYVSVCVCANVCLCMYV